jgi:hypothetical protein
LSSSNACQLIYCFQLWKVESTWGPWN